MAQSVLTGAAAFGDWHGDAPGVWWHITADALPAPYESGSASRSPDVIAQPRGVTPSVPAGFTISLFASGLDTPRTLRTAPNGDIFLAESGAGAIRVYTGQQSRVFASNLTLPYGIGFWPPGPTPKFVYVAETNRVVRFPYPNGGRPEVVVPSLPEGGHWTRDIAFSPDGTRMFVSVGSATNVMTGVDPSAEQGRAAVLSFTPEGQDRRIYASGLRNCSGEAIQPSTGTLWCAVNERDGLGDDLPPDFATSVREGGFYGWPWFYIGDHPDPRHSGAASRPVVVPDVLIQPHSAPLGIAFYDRTAFPRSGALLTPATRRIEGLAASADYEILAIKPGAAPADRLASARRVGLASGHFGPSGIRPGRTGHHAFRPDAASTNLVWSWLR
jgi:glucose/arabinose dehydrogenase